MANKHKNDMHRLRKELAYGMPPKCPGTAKVIYDTQREAIGEAKVRYAVDKIALRVYPCAGHWHLTKTFAVEGDPTKKSKKYL